MTTSPDPDLWRIRGPDGVVHWRNENYGIHVSDWTRCGRNCASLYEFQDPRSWAEQIIQTAEPVTCLPCLAQGPKPPYVDEENTDGFGPDAFEDHDD